MTPSQNEAIQQFWKANQNNPQAIMQAMNEYGVSGADLSQAIGKPLSELRTYFGNAGAAQNFGGISNGFTTDQWQQKIDDYANQNGVQRWDLSAPDLGWLRNSDDPLASWKSVNAFQYRGGGNEQASADTAFGPGQSQANANNINGWGNAFNQAAASAQANGGVPNWNQATPGSYTDQQQQAAQQAAQQGNLQGKPLAVGGAPGAPGAPGGGLGFGGGGWQPLGAGGASGAGGSGGGTGSSTYGPNPYLQQNADALVKQANNNLNDTILPGIRSGAQAAGQYGSSRQGIAEGVAAGRNNEGIASALASLYGNAYNTDQSNDTARIGLANNYNLGLGNLNNQSIANNQSFYTAQRGQDLTQYGLGANLFQSGVQGNLGIGAGQYGLGQTYQNAPLTSLQQYSNTISPYSGLNSTQAAAPAGTSPALAGVGGALAGYQTYQNLYQGGGTNNVYNTGNSNLSYGGGSGYGGSTYGGYGSFGG